jgi:hypothetical protein
MNLLGLHPLDTAILLLYVGTVLWIGQHLSRKNKTEDEFFLGGRRMGKWFQFFLNLGNMSDPSFAPATTASVYKEGIGGIWLLLITLFLTPYYWFMNVWFRRVRLTTISELFEDRFGSRFLSSLYAIFAIFFAILNIAFGNIVALKTLQPIMIKPESAYTHQDRLMLSEFKEYQTLHKLREEVSLTTDQSKRYEVVKSLHDLGKIQPFVSYLKPVSFYVFTSALVAVFIVLGGLSATAVINAIQTVLIMIISVILIPFGLMRIGGFAGLHERVPEQMFRIFGDDSMGSYTWYSIAALLLVAFIGITAAPASMTIGGSAQNEMAARMGAVTGGFGKRFLTIAWGMTGLIALGLWGAGQTDADQIWGRLTLFLLPVGLIGVMIIGILGGKLAYLGAQSVVLSALVVKNLYEPLVPGRSMKHYMLVARISIPLILGSGILVALCMSSAISLIKFIIVLQVTWGVPILFLFQWRRLTKTAVIVQVIATLLLIGIIPFAVSAIPLLRSAPSLTVMTHEIVSKVTKRTTQADVAEGKAKIAGEKITKEHRTEPVSIYFEEGVALTDPANPKSTKEGLGRFNLEVYLLHLAGVRVEDFTPPMIQTTRYLVDALVPILLLIVVSLMTPGEEKLKVARFYARLKTPVGETPEADAEAVALSNADPTRFDHCKMFPKSNLEFTKWDRTDWIGFLACCAVVGLILLFLQGLMLIGSSS